MCPGRAGVSVTPDGDGVRNIIEPYVDVNVNLGGLESCRPGTVKLGREKSSFFSVVKVAEGEIPEKGHGGRVAASRQGDQGVSSCAFEVGLNLYFL